MIKQAKIKNFEVHKDVDIELSPGVNIITGDTDAGKSSLMRALRLVVFNRPSGDSIISWGENEVSVSVKTFDNQVVERIKNKKQNSYLLNNQELKAVGKDVPERVAEVLNLSDTNFQKQLDRPFLLLDSPGEIAQFLNSIVGLSDIDKSLSNIQREYSQAKNYVSILEEEQTKLEGDLTAYVGLEFIGEHIENIEKLYSELEYETLQIKTISDRHTELDSINILLEGIREVPDVRSLLLSIQQYNSLNTEYMQVASYQLNLKQVIEQLISIKDIPDTSHFKKYFEEYYIQDMEIKTIVELDAQYQGSSLKEDMLIADQVILDEKYNELSLIVCPTCGRPL